MTVSLIINTAAGGDTSIHNSSKNAFHTDRAFALRNLLLPQYCSDAAIDEVIVVGEWEPGPDYRYIHSPSTWFNCVDALTQRQLGFEAATGDTLIFMHDDHWLPYVEYNKVRGVCVPERWTRLRHAAGERLNNGAADGYIGGHCAIYNRHVLEECPWAAVPRVHTWDVEHTRQIRDAGFSITWSNMLRVWDIEKGSAPWG